MIIRDQCSQASTSTSQSVKTLTKEPAIALSDSSPREYISLMSFFRHFASLRSTATYRNVLTLSASRAPRHFSRNMSDLSIEQSINEKFVSQSKKGQGESEAFLSAFRERRTYYQISKNAAIPDSRVEEIVKFAIKHVPSSL